MPVTFAPFGVYTQPTNTLVQAGQDEVIAMIDAFIALMPVIVGGVGSSESSAASPEFVDINLHYIEKITAEMADIKLKIDAMPVV